VTPLVWLALAAGAGLSAWLVAWPAVTSYRSREARDLNAERYLAWRGRARPRVAGGSLREVMTGAERRRIVIGSLLAAAAVATVLIFFLNS